MLLRFLAALLAALALPVLATPQPRNTTDMWFTASESGWGLNLIHQGNSIFGTLFVYGPDGQPKWYLASNVAGGPSAYAGPLAECTGSWFGRAFDTRELNCRQVGTISLEVGDSSASLRYSVDGVQVTKQLTRFTFRPINLTALYRAFVYQAASGGLPQVGRDLERFSVVDTGSRVDVDASSDSESGCTYSGGHAQDGQAVIVSGTYRCTATSGDWSMRIDPTPFGFAGTFADGRSPAARVAGAIFNPPKMEGTGWRNGMWFVPSESGWGLNLIEQGDTMFGTLFVYDAQSRPRWFVASDLVQSGTTADGTAVNSGALYEQTGPYFGASFNPSAVARRQVGTLSFQVLGPGTARAIYTIDGVSVTKTLTNFTFAGNDPSGAYRGQITGTGPGGSGHDPVAITIQGSPSGGAFSMRIDGTYGGLCDYTGTSRQVGAVLNASGKFTCGGGAAGDFSMPNLTVEADGVTGQMQITNSTGFVQGGLTSFTFAGAR